MLERDLGLPILTAIAEALVEERIYVRSETPDGRHIFLELNPCGEFFWLERSPGLPISDAIADVLLGQAPRR